MYIHLCTATLTTLLKPIDQRNKVDVAMQNHDPGESFRGFTPTCGKWQQDKITLFLSSARAKRNDGKHQPVTKVHFSLSYCEDLAIMITNDVFRPLTTGGALPNPLRDPGVGRLENAL